MAVAKRKTRARKLTGIAGAPTHKSFEDLKYYFHYEVDRKDIITLMKTYVRRTFDRKVAAAINANPDYKFAVVAHMAAAIHWMDLGKEFEQEKYKPFPDAIAAYMERLAVEGKDLIKEKTADAPKKEKLTPQQSMILKANETIMVDLDNIEDTWLEGKEVPSFDVYAKLTEHDLKGPVAPRMVRDWCDYYIEQYELKEGYEHLKAAVIKKRLKLLNQMKLDVERFSDAQKTTRKPRARKPRAADSQVKSLKYMTESVEYKVKSINPVVIPGAQRLYVFNARNRELTEYVALGPAGLEVKGTTIRNFDVEQSRKIKLRKPDDMLAIVLKKTSRQIGNAWDKLTGKNSVPTGRIGPDLILVRVLNQ